MSRVGTRNAHELLAVDVPEVISTGLRTTDPARQLLIEAAVPAALQVARAGAQPRSLRFLAQVVRRGGLVHAAQLVEPMPTPEQSAVVRPWLMVAHGDEVFAGWLDAVASIVEAGLSRPGPTPG